MKTLICSIFSLATAVAQTIVAPPLTAEVGHVSAQLMISYEEQSWPITAVSYDANTVTYTLPGHSLTVGTAASLGPKAASTSAACGLTGLSMMQPTTLNVISVNGDSVTFNDSGVGGTHTGSCRIYKNLPSGTALEYGTTPSYGIIATTSVSTNPEIAVAYLTSLKPDSQYFYRWTLPGGATAAGTFTTLPAGAVELPQPVAEVSAVVKTGPVGGTYNPDLNVLPDCSNLGKTSAESGTIMSQLAGLTGTNHQRVVFPAGTVCQDGQYIWPPRPNHSGWVVVSSSTASTALPPAGVRFTPNFAAGTYKFLHTMNVAGSAGTSANSLSTVTNCQTGLYGGEDSFYVLNVPAGHFPFAICSSTKWPAYTGTVRVTTASGTTTGPVTWFIPGHTITKGMIVTIPQNSFTGTSSTTGFGDFYVESVVPGVSITLFNNKRASNSSTLDLAFDVVVRNNWRVPTATVGISDPEGFCDEGSGNDAGRMFYYNTDKNQAWWCVDDTGHNYTSTVGAWRRLNKIANTGSFSGMSVVRVDPAAARYHFIGMEIVAGKVPNPPPAGWYQGHNSGTLTSYNRQGGYMAMLDMAGTQIIFDRGWIHAENGAAPPIRIHGGVLLTADDSALVNTYIDDVVNWQYIAYGDFEGSTGISHYQGGPTLIQNNTIYGGTINYYSEDSPGVLPHDLTFRRNLMTKHKKWRIGSVEHAAAYAATPYSQWKTATRNAWEWKQGHRALVEGNISEYNWTSWTHGQHFTLTTRRNSHTNWPDEAITGIDATGVVTLAAASFIRTGDAVHIRSTSSTDHNYQVVKVAAGCDLAACTSVTVSGLPSTTSTGGYIKHVWANRGLQDINIRWNLLRHSTDVLRMLSYEGLSTTSVQTAYLRRVAFTDNLIYNQDTRAYSSGGWNTPDGKYSNNHGGVRYYYSIGNTEHNTVARNTVYGLQGSMNRVISSETTSVKDYGLVWKDDLHHAFGNIQAANTDSAYGTAAIVAGWENNTVGTNVLCCGFGSQSAMNPGALKWPTVVADVSWDAPGTSGTVDFRLRYNSRFISGYQGNAFCEANPTQCARASHGGDIGVDVDTLDTKLGIVKNVRVRSVVPTSAIVSYLAPDSDPCTVEYSTSPAWGTGSRTVDEAGDRVRNVQLSGLTPATDYHYRILCAVEQPSGTFRTLNE